MVYGSHECIVELSGCISEPTTNQRVILTAAIQALASHGLPKKLEVFANSQYLSLGMSEWVHAWQATGRLTDGSILNHDLWQNLILAATEYEIQWNFVKTSGKQAENPHLRRASVLAHAAAGMAPTESTFGKSPGVPYVHCRTPEKHERNDSPVGT